MPFDVFISYSSKDKTAGDATCAALEAAGLRCWIAPRDVPPGSDWAGSIVDAIDHCRLMILVFSANANGSRQVHREVQRAFEREVPVVPFRIENIAPEKALAYYVGSVHWLDALTPPLEKHLERLVKASKGILEAGLVDPVVKEKAEAPPPRLQHPPPLNRRFLWFRQRRYSRRLPRRRASRRDRS
jgi:TIR domain